MQLHSGKHVKIKGRGGGGGEGVGSKQACHCLIPVALPGGAHLEPGDNPLVFILSSPGLPEARQYFCWLLGILNVPPEP